MKKLAFGLILGFACVTTGHAAQIVSNFTGDLATFAKVNVSSSTASSLAGYSASRLELTCVNGDSSNAVYIGTSSVITAAGSFSFPVFAKQAITLDSHTSLYGIADVGVSSVNIYCITENP